MDECERLCIIWYIESAEGKRVSNENDDDNEE